jgi:hypothetical protein
MNRKPGHGKGWPVGRPVDGGLGFDDPARTARWPRRFGIRPAARTESHEALAADRWMAIDARRETGGRG